MSSANTQLKIILKKKTKIRQFFGIVCFELQTKLHNAYLQNSAYHKFYIKTQFTHNLLVSPSDNL